MIRLRLNLQWMDNNWPFLSQLFCIDVAQIVVDSQPPVVLRMNLNLPKNWLYFGRNQQHIKLYKLQSLQSLVQIYFFKILKKHLISLFFGFDENFFFYWKSFSVQIMFLLFQTKYDCKRWCVSRFIITISQLVSLVIFHLKTRIQFMQ